MYGENEVDYKAENLNTEKVTVCNTEKKLGLLTQSGVCVCVCVTMCDCILHA